MLLARTLNYRSLEEMGNTMDGAEYCLWAAEFDRNPWDEKRADLRAGIISAAVANMAGKTRKATEPPCKPLDFMPYSQPPPESIQPSADDLNQFLNDFAQNAP